MYRRKHNRQQKCRGLRQQQHGVQRQLRLEKLENRDSPGVFLPCLAFHPDGQFSSSLSNESLETCAEHAQTKDSWFQEHGVDTNVAGIMPLLESDLVRQNHSAGKKFDHYVGCTNYDNAQARQEIPSERTKETWALLDWELVTTNLDNSVSDNATTRSNTFRDYRIPLTIPDVGSSAVSNAGGGASALATATPTGATAMGGRSSGRGLSSDASGNGASTVYSASNIVAPAGISDETSATATETDAPSLSDAGPADESALAEIKLISTHETLEECPAVEPGDYDGDLDRDGRDFLIWQRTFSQTVSPVGSGADGNRNGVVDAEDLQIWQNYYGSTVTGPGPFCITGPAGPSIPDNTPTITWHASVGAASYEVVVAADANFTEIVQSNVTTDLTSTIVTPLSNGNYYISVTARDDQGNERVAANNLAEILVAAPQLLANDGFEASFMGWTTFPGTGAAIFTTPSVSPYVGTRSAQINVSNPGTSAPNLTTTFYAEAAETYLLRWFAKANVNRPTMKIHVSSDGTDYSPAMYNPSSNGWEAYNFAFKASGLTTVTFSFEQAAIYSLDELQIYETDSGPDHTGTYLDPERHYLWQWGQTVNSTGGLTNTDNDISVPLPDGRVIWLFNDTYTGRVNPYNNSSGYSGFVRNYLMIEDRGTLTPWTPSKTSFSPPTSGNWYWPNDAFVEGDKLKIVLHEVTNNGGYGAFVGSAIATLSLPGLTLDGISANTPWNVNKVLDAGDGNFYIYGGLDGPGDTGVARAVKGSFSNVSAWQYWNGSNWVANSTAAIELSNLDSAWSITRIGPNNYVATIGGFVGSTMRASFASSPTGPWTSSVVIGRPPDPFEALTSFYYMPYLHKDTVQNGVYSVGYSDIGPSGADGDGPFLSNRPGADKNHYNIQYFLTPNLLELSPFTTQEFTDSFTDNDPVEWKSYDGIWTASGGKFSMAPRRPFDVPKAIALGVVNESLLLETDVSATGGHAGVIFRGSEYGRGENSFDGYYAAIRPGYGVLLGTMKDGLWTLLAETPMDVANGSNHHLKVVADDDLIKVFVDDLETPRIMVTDSTFSRGSSGLRASSSIASWDNFTVSEIGTPPTV
jgi:hypothetical protein